MRRCGIHKRNHIYWISFQDLAGKQRRESTGSTNRRVAERMLDARKGQVVEARLGLPRSHTPLLKDFAKDFLEGVPHERTRDRYQDSVNALVDFFGKIHMGDITPEAIYKFQRHRIAKGRSAATANRDKAVLSRMFRKAKKLRYIQQNPCEDVDSLNERQERRQAQPLSFEEEGRLLACCELLLRTFVILLIDTGLRPRKEAAPLLWANVDLDSERASIFVTESKTRSGIRTVPLSPRCLAELKNWRNLCGPGNSPYVFPSPRDSQKHWSVYQDSWERAIKKANLPGRRAYDLRSTFATRAHAACPNNLAVSRLMGHSSPAILSTYAKACETVDYEVIAKMDALRVAHESPKTIQ